MSELEHLADAILEQETGLAEGRYRKAGDSLVPGPVAEYLAADPWLHHVTPEHVDGWTRRLWSISQDGKMIISLAGELQSLAGEMREAAGLEEL